MQMILENPYFQTSVFRQELVIHKSGNELIEVLIIVQTAKELLLLGLGMYATGSNLELVLPLNNCVQLED